MKDHAFVTASESQNSGDVARFGVFHRLFSFEWPDSLWFNAAIAGIVGFLYALYLLGPAPLNPSNIKWLHGDAAMYFAGWTLFRQDPHLHWPLTFTERIGYPIGQSIALMDVNPLLALLLRPLSPLLSEPFQYLGLEAILACALQFFFALRLFRLLSGPNLFAIVLPALYFLVSPPMTLRMGGHYALTNHWLLTAALFVFCFAHRESVTSIKRFVTMALILAAISFSINPYLAFQVLLLLATAVIGLLWERRLTIFAAVGTLGALGAISAAAAYVFGFVVSGGQEYGNVGYRYYSFNLLSPFDPNQYGSLLFHALPHFTDGQYEGYCYLGAGVMLLAIVVGLIGFWQGSNLLWFQWRPKILLVLCCSLLTVMAFSTEITMGSKLLVDLDPSQKLSPYLATLRSCGRLFWTPYYVLLMILLTAPYRVLNRRRAAILLAVTLAVQLADLIPLQRSVHAGVNQPFEAALKSPIWHRLGSSYQNLIVLPAFQCDQNATPGKADGFEIFGVLAAEQRMRTNSYNSGRFTKVSQNFHCVESLSTLTARPLSSASVYVVTPPLAIRITSSGTGKCHNLDGFILCSANDDFGLGPAKWDSQTEFWVRSHFKTILLRDPTDLELMRWTKALDQGTKSSVDFIGDLLTSTEFEQNSLPRFWRYLDAQGRWPTLAEWLANNPPQSIATGNFSHENKHVFHDRNRAIVYMLYFAVLERDPDPIGLSGWPGILAQTSIQNVALQFLNGSEYKSHQYLGYH